MSQKSTKRALATSALSLAVSLALLAGTTFAWFTDSVTNTGNVIQAGNLSIDALAYDLDAAGDKTYTIEGVNGGEPITFAAMAQDLKEDASAIIDETLWEPGKSSAKLLEVVNNGSLAAKIQLEFTLEDGGLMDALWFDFVQIKNGEPVGRFTPRDMRTINDVADTMDDTVLLPEESLQFVLVYGMYEEAGNEYMGKDFAANVTIRAAQAAVEQDGFGSSEYDLQADYYAEVSTTEEFAEKVENLQPNEALRLTDDIDFGTQNIPMSQSGTTNIDLNGKTLTADSVTVTDGENLNIQDGGLELAAQAVTNSSISTEKGGRVLLNGVDYKTTGTAVYAAGDGAVVDIIDSVIECAGYCVTTNASTTENHNPVFNIRNSTLTSTDVGTAVLVNVPCQLNMTNCTVNGTMHGVVVRGGTAVLENCTLTLTQEDDSVLHYFDNRDWGTGNEINLAALTLGNKGGGNYQYYPTNCTLINTKLISVGPYPTLYAYGNTGEGLGVTLTYDAASVVGEIIKGNDAVTVIGPGE